MQIKANHFYQYSHPTFAPTPVAVIALGPVERDLLRYDGPRVPVLTEQGRELMIDPAHLSALTLPCPRPGAPMSDYARQQGWPFDPLAFTRP